MRSAVAIPLSALLLVGADCGEPPAEPTACELSPDQDGDGEDSTACGGTDCDDTDATRRPGSAEVCDLANHDEDCDPTTFGDRDADGDGYVDVRCENFSETGGRAGGDDCDDSRADTHPDLPEVCDTRDNNCDGAIDEGVLFTLYVDTDLDGYGTDLEDTTQGCTLLQGYSFVSSDCDDARDDVHPGLPELCDGLDNDCNGEDDEGAMDTFFVDDDHDGFGTSETVDACTEEPGIAVRSGDCDDANAAIVNGSMRCENALEYVLCDDGAWTGPANCPTQQCLAQPNGVGICR
jgi:Putative metal-binding motif